MNLISNRFEAGKNDTNFPPNPKTAPAGRLSHYENRNLKTKNGQMCQAVLWVHAGRVPQERASRPRLPA